MGLKKHDGLRKGTKEYQTVVGMWGKERKEGKNIDHFSGSQLLV